MMKAGRESRNKEPSFAPRVREHRLLETVFPVTCGDKSFYMIIFFSCSMLINTMVSRLIEIKVETENH